MFSPCSAKIRASDKDLPVSNTLEDDEIYCKLPKLLGQVMKLSKGKANALRVKEKLCSCDDWY